MRIDGKAAPQVALGRIARVLWLVPAMDRLWIEGAEGRRRFLDRMTMSFEPGHADAVLAYEKAMRERNRLLKEQVRDAAWYGALEGQMAEAGAAIIGQPRGRARRGWPRRRTGPRPPFPPPTLALSHPEGELPDGAAALAAALRGGAAAGHGGRAHA